MAVECDVLVVGAGPAGSSVARATAMNGAKTILIEEDCNAGMNIKCAESVSKYLFPYLPFKIPNEQLRWEMKGIRFWAEDILIEKIGEPWGGYSINREKFDKWLSNGAIKAGAKLLTNTKLVDLDFDDNYVVKTATVKVHLKGGKEIKPKIIVGADGVNSTVSKRLNVRHIKKGDIGKLVAYDMKNLNLDYPHYDQIFLGDFAPGSYAYIMPKSKNVASVGVGTTIEKIKEKLEEYFEEFMNLNIVKKQVKDRVITDEKSGEAPVGFITDKWVYGNVLLVGDAANQNIKPFIEGIIPGIVCGDIAGKLASECISTGLSLNEREYRKRVYDKIDCFKDSDKMIDIIRGETFDPFDKKRHLFHLGLCSGILSVTDIKKLMHEDYDVVKNKILNSVKIENANQV